jgi:glutamine synthetase
LKKDTTDRNRTSPFAFTGNKFEFRAVGSSATNATGITILNTVVANSLIQLKQEIESAMKGKSFKEAAVEVLRKWTKESKAVRFEGNGYSEEWHKEAAKRGLPNLRTTPEALGAFEDHKTAKIFENLGVLSEREFHAWYHVKLERYSKDLDIEAKVMKEIVDTQILPVAIEYQNELIANVSGLKELSIDAAAQNGLLKTVNGHVSALVSLSADLEKARDAAASNGDAKPQAFAYEAMKSKFFDKIRENVDALEAIVPDALWPLPKYREILFLSK